MRSAKVKKSHLFDWKQADQTATGYGFSERGMSVKLVQTGGGDPSAPDLWQSAGTGNVSILRHNTIPWQDFTEYQFNLTFFPGTFQIEVSQGATSLEFWTVNDNTYTDGKFGFYNFSQGNVQYAGFTQEDDPTLIPEPLTMLGLTLAVGGLAGYIRKRVPAGAA